MTPIVSKILKIIFLGALLAVLTKYILSTDFDAIGEYLVMAPLVLPLLLLVSLGSHTTGNIAWKLSMGEESEKTNFIELFFMRLVSENLAVFNPANVVAGDGLKSIFLNKLGVDYKTGIASVLLSRVLLIVSAVVLMLGSMLYLMIGSEDQVPYYIIATMALVGVCFCIGLLYLFLDKRKLLYKVAIRVNRSKLGKWFTEAHVQKIDEINIILVDYYRSSKLKLAGAFSFSILHWIFGALEFFVILLFFGVGVSILDAVTIEMGVLGFKTAGSMIPGQIGVEEYGNKVMLGAVGVGIAEIWIIVSVLRRARQLFWLLITAVASAVLYKRYKIQPAN